MPRKQVHNVQLMQSKLEESLRGKLSDIRGLILLIGQQQGVMLEELLQKINDKNVLWQLHTWKGLARTLGLKALATLIHDIEGSLNTVKEQNDVFAA